MNTPVPFIYCWICAAERPREAFSKRGRSLRLSTHCIPLPEQEAKAGEQRFEMWEMSCQANISSKNLERLQLLRGSRDYDVAQLADLMLRLAYFQKQKKRRLKNLIERDPWHLFDLEKAGLVDYEHFQNIDCDWLEEYGDLTEDARREAKENQQCFGP